MRRLLLALALLLAGMGPASAIERVLDFEADIVLAPDGSLTVTETITVEAEGNEIRHGIYRDVATTLPDEFGLLRRTGLTVLSVTREGQPEPYTTERTETGERIRIGRSGSLLPRDSVRYVIAYRIKAPIRFLKDHDELRWNVTGHGWTLAIAHAGARVTLPRGARIVRSAFETGRVGARGEAGYTRSLSDRAIEFWTTAPLGAAEGLTVTVGIPKGVVEPRGRFDRRDLASPAVLIALAGCLGLPLYFLLVRRRLGREPPPVPVTPRAEPPDGLPPASLGYLHRRGYDTALFAGLLTGLAVKPCLRIGRTRDRYHLSRAGGAPEQAGVDPLSAAIASRLLGARNELILGPSAAIAVAAATMQLRRGLRRQAQPAWFSDNIRWQLGGAAMVIGALLAAGARMEEGGRNALIMSLVLAMAVTSLVVMWRNLRRASWERRGAEGFSARLMLRMGVTVAAIVAIGVGAVMIRLGIESAALATLTAFGTTVCVGMAPRFSTTTPEGARLRAATEGFRRYLTTGVAEQPAGPQPPAITPERFESLLPHAIALGCQSQWAARFAATAAGAAYTPGGWCSSDVRLAGPADVAAFAGPSLATALEKATTDGDSPSDPSDRESSGSSSSGSGSGGGGGGDRD